jgi:hypothetical protein
MNSLRAHKIQKGTKFIIVFSTKKVKEAFENKRMRCATLFLLYSVMGETICKFNGIRRRRNVREIETDYSEESEPKEMNIFLLRIEG